jgi:signal peptidase II
VVRPRISSPRRLGAIALVASVVLLADQLTKDLALGHLRDGPVHLLGPLSLQLEFNSGIAFSLLSGIGAPLIALVVVVVLVVLLLGRAVPGRLGAVACGMVLGGALGNLADRLFRASGEVVDFLHTSFWPTFNLADSCVVIGSLLLGAALLRVPHAACHQGEQT